MTTPNAPRTIVLVDDDRDIRAMLRLALKPLGHEIVEAADSEAAWREVLAHWPALVVSDVAMPGESGIELCRRLAKSAMNVKVVIYSGGMATEEEATAAGAVAFISKGQSINRVRQVVASLCAASEPELSAPAADTEGEARAS
jgi:DNA-binding NtrC family response regulator